MIPASLLADLGISLTDLLASADIAGELKSALSIARGKGPASGVFLRYANAYKQYAPGAPWAEISQSYKEAKAWSALGQAVRGPYEDIPIDPNLYRPTTAYGEYAGEYGGFVTKVRVTITDPATGDSRSYGINIHDFVTWNTSDIGSYAISSVEEIIGHSPTIGGATDLDGLDVTYEITDLLQII